MTVLTAQKGQPATIQLILCIFIYQTSRSSWEYSLLSFSLGVNHVVFIRPPLKDGTALAKQTQDKDTPWNAYDVQADRVQAASKMLQAAGICSLRGSKLHANQKSYEANKMY